MILIGFTGSRAGMTFRQKTVLRGVLAEFVSPAGCELHHGDCVGADAEAVGIAREAGYRVVCHPPTDARLRAHAPSDLVLPAAPYLARNRAIVDDCAVLVAAPRDFAEQQRSGTWATIRYARKVGRRTIIIRPSGDIERSYE